MNYVVSILPLAEFDFRKIFSYIEKRSPQGASSWKAAFEGVLPRLVANPMAFGPAPESEDLKVDLRQAIFKTKSGLKYRAVFLIEDEMVYILRLRGPGQPPLSANELPSV